MIATAAAAKTADTLANGDVVAAQDGYTLGVVVGQAGLAQGDGVVVWIDRADRNLDDDWAIVRYARAELVPVFTVRDWEVFTGE